MRITRSIDECREATSVARAEKRIVGLVPTMGALHDGHLALIKRARAECGFVVVSIFVNPTQFGPSEDFKEYPRNLERDATLCEQQGVDVVFNPREEEMYPRGFASWVQVDGLTERFEGAARPGHFRGVTTVCAKLFNITQPDYAYFGTKDYQQLKVVQKMVRDLNMPIRIVPVETVREPDGLAMSSRNTYLNPSERQSALVLSRAIREAAELFAAGERDAKKIQLQVESLLKAERNVHIDYVAVADAETLEAVTMLDRDSVLLLAVRIGRTRLIDNVVLRLHK